MSLPITARQMNALRALQKSHPDLGKLASQIALAFDASKIDNPELARAILEKTCRRIVASQPGSRAAMAQHLQHFASLSCLTDDQAADFIQRIQKIG